MLENLSPAAAARAERAGSTGARRRRRADAERSARRSIPRTVVDAPAGRAARCVAIGRARRGPRQTPTQRLDDSRCSCSTSRRRCWPPPRSAALFALLRGYAARASSSSSSPIASTRCWTIADRVTVLRDGRVVASTPAAELGYAELASLIAGRQLAALGAKAPGAAPAGAAVPC